MMPPDEFKALVRARGRRVPRVLPRQQHPDRIAEKYTRAINVTMVWAMKEVREKLVPLLMGAANEASKIATTDASAGEELDAMLDELRAAWDRRWSRQRLTALVTPVADETTEFQAQQLNRQLGAYLGQETIDVVGSEPWLPGAVRDFTRENVALIKTIPSRFFNELETSLSRDIADGARWETMATTIEKRYEVSKSRAKLIARDQVGKFNGDLNRVRQQDLGIDKFTWRTMRDNRVREEHQDYEGQTYAWGQAPDGGPGEPVQCRCYAEPDIASILANA